MLVTVTQLLLKSNLPNTAFFSIYNETTCFPFFYSYIFFSRVPYLPKYKKTLNIRQPLGY